MILRAKIRSVEIERGRLEQTSYEERRGRPAPLAGEDGYRAFHTVRLRAGEQ